MKYELVKDDTKLGVQASITWTPEDGLRPQDIRVEMYPPQPTFGMVVGMSKGVRLIHTPTGAIVECDTERSQHRNREVALKKLEAALAEQPAPVQQEPVAHAKDLIEGLYENGDPVSVDAAELLEQLTSPQPAQQALQRIMMRLADLLDEDQFAEIESIVVGAGVTPQAQRKPLTDDEIESMWIGSVGFLDPMLNQHTRLAFARAIEAKHGIKENI